MTTLKRPALRYHGGKWKIAPRIIPLLPPHRCYVEPFGGAAGILLRKPRSYAEVYNDLDGEVVSYFRVLRDPVTRAKLCEAMALTPFAREEFDAAYQITDEPVERARRLVIRSFMGFGSDGHNDEVNTGFRANSNRSGTTPAHDWANLPPHIAAVGERFSGVVIENREAVKVMLSHDAPTTLHYVDPPYMPETRSIKSRRQGEGFKAYRHEMSAADHRVLLSNLTGLQGMVVLSGYASALYDAWLGADWRRIEFEALADGARPRVEVLWINPAAQAALDQRARSGPLFEGAA